LKVRYFDHVVVNYSNSTWTFQLACTLPERFMIPPIPAAARYCKAGHPRPPAPTTTTDEFCNLSCPWTGSTESRQNLHVRYLRGRTHRGSSGVHSEDSRQEQATFNNHGHEAFDPNAFCRPPWLSQSPNAPKYYTLVSSFKPIATCSHSRQPTRLRLCCRGQISRRVLNGLSRRSNSVSGQTVCATAIQIHFGSA
jgi:hypothetical protein